MRHKMNADKRGIMIFAGTTEGRRLCEALDRRGIRAAARVATEYGERAMPRFDNIEVTRGRLDRDGMAELIDAGGYGLIVDATHPYAGEASQNAKAACDMTGAKYVRLLRGGVGTGADGGVIRVGSALKAYEYLRDSSDKGLSGNILLTIGSGELDAFCADAALRERLIVRVLPCAEALRRCDELGIPARNVVAAQGPFSAEFNAAILRQYRCAFIVTKDTGAEGGLPEKLEAAREAGVTAIMIGRPLAETGCSLEGALAEIDGFLNIDRRPQSERQTFFPFFMSSEGKRALVIGAGRVASRRAETLLRFKFEVTVIAPEISAGVLSLSENGLIGLRIKAFSDEDLDGYDIIVCATDNRAVNQRAGRLARERGLPASVADAAEECGFLFPAVIIKDGVTVAAAGDGRSHGAVRGIADKLRAALR